MSIETAKLCVGGSSERGKAGLKRFDYSFRVGRSRRSPVSLHRYKSADAAVYWRKGES